MRMASELTEENCNTEDFITEIEKWPAIWDLFHDDYTNKNAKKNAWESVIRKYIRNFPDMSGAEKNSIVNSYQRKWKSLRDSYTREKSKQRKETKSGSAAKYRKKYVFFKQLQFLETATKSTEDNLAKSDEEMSGEEDSREEEAIDDARNDKGQGRTKGKKRRNKADQGDDALLNVLKAKHFCQEIGKNKDDGDDDKLFLLSLHHDLRTLPDHLKLNVKSQMIGALSFAKQAAYVSTTAAVQCFSSSPYQHQLPSPAYPQQPSPQSFYHQRPLSNQSFTMPPYQLNGNYQEAEQHGSPVPNPEEMNSNKMDNIKIEKDEVEKDLKESRDNEMEVEPGKDLMPGQSFRNDVEVESQDDITEAVLTNIEKELTEMLFHMKKNIIDMSKIHVSLMKTTCTRLQECKEKTEKLEKMIENFQDCAKSQ